MSYFSNMRRVNMNHKNRQVLAYALVGLLFIAPTVVFSQIESAKLLHTILDEYWAHKKADSAVLDQLEGKKVSKLPEVSLADTQAEADFSASLLKQLQQVNVQELSHADWINYEVLKWQLEYEVEYPKYFWFSVLLPPISQHILGANRNFTGFAFKENQDLKAYLDLLEQYPAFIQNVYQITQEQFNRGIILPKEVFPLMEPSLKSLLMEGENSILYVKDQRLDKIDPNRAKAFQKKVLEKIDQDIFPNLKVLVEFVQGDYLHKAPDGVGLSQYPQGRDFYRYLVKINTTLDIPPEEIHLIGLEEVQKIEAKVERIKESLGFEGTLDDFRHFLKTDPRFFPKTPQDVEDRLMFYVKAMDSKLDEYFLKKPKAPYGIKRLDPELEGSMTFGYYQQPTKSNPKGNYMYNGSKLDERSLLMAEALIYHELVPGHHFHIASQIENEAIPEFRRYLFPNGYNEGWAEYAGWLGVEMGLYEDPYSLIGKHMLDMMLATRLVVDTGMNYFGWPRSMAVKYMRDHMIESETQLYTESLRYSIRSPAQALGYKLGSIKVLELREKAEKSLGEDFDIKRFHQAMLENGGLPLFILEKHIDWFIAQELNNQVLCPPNICFRTK